MSTMNAKVYFIAIVVLLVPAIYAGIGILHTLHAVFGN